MHELACHVTAYQSIDDIQIRMQPVFQDMCLDLLGDGERMDVDARFEDEGEGVLARRQAERFHLDVEVDGVGWGGGLGEGADEGVPHEGVGVGGAGEDGDGVVEGAGGGESGEGDEAAGCVVVVGTAGDDHLGVDLEELLHGGAAVGEEGEGWRFDGFGWNGS